jgi:hypothetical protein
MLPDGPAYTAEQLERLKKVYDELTGLFEERREYAEGLAKKTRQGQPLNEQELKDMALFHRVTENIGQLEASIVGELSAQIIGISENIKLKARDGDIDAMLKWQKIEPLYHWYMKIYTEKALPRN